jgi:hypothetical protein
MPTTSPISGETSSLNMHERLPLLATMWISGR